MSGGVDSSVAAALMVEEGHEVVGVTLKLWSGPNGEAPTAGCCTVSDAEDARRVAAQLDIPYYVLNYTDEFKRGVVDRFISDYLDGRTPNPCVECNRTIKFSRLLDQATDLGCDLVVTGHYARTRYVHGRWQLLQATDQNKDQSYVLYMLGQDQLQRVRFPVGELVKVATRERAAGLKLRTAAKPDSQDICFAGVAGYRNFLRQQVPTAGRPGNIVDDTGSVIGRHDGITNFTVGQRRGTGLALGERRYVTKIDAGTATITLGPSQQLDAGGLRLENPRWVDEPPPDGEELNIKVRYNGDHHPCRVYGDVVRFVQPVRAVAAGQTGVLYREDAVVGGGTISSALGVAN